MYAHPICSRQREVIHRPQSPLFWINFIEDGCDGLESVAFKPIVYVKKQPTQSIPCQCLPNQFGSGNTGVFVWFLKLIVGAEFIHRLLILATRLEQQSRSREL